MFKQVEIPGKGQGLVATAELPAGTIIIQESPLIIVEKDGVAEIKQLVAKFRSLTFEQKNQVLSLHDPGPNSNVGMILKVSLLTFDETEEKAVRIFMSNGMDYIQAGDLNRVGLYNTMSRVNHSCTPNVVWTWIQEDTNVTQMRVCRKIKEGEEILADYCLHIYSFPSKDERQKMLKNWNFTCNCEVCSLTGDKLIENEKARKRLRELHEVLYANEPVDNEQALKAVKEKWKIMKTMRKEMIAQLPFAMLQCCYIAALCKLPSSSSAELMKKAKEMSELFGDFHVESYMNVEKMIKEIRR